MTDDSYVPRHRADVPTDYIRLAPTRPATSFVTSTELAQMRAAYQDSDYLARLAMDARVADMVEVDNPFRTELRPRRGTER